MSGRAGVLLSVVLDEALELLQIDALQTVGDFATQKAAFLKLADPLECVSPDILALRAVHEQTRPFLVERRDTQVPAPTCVDYRLQFVVAAFVKENMTLTLQRKRTFEHAVLYFFGFQSLCRGERGSGIRVRRAALCVGRLLESLLR